MSNDTQYTAAVRTAATPVRTGGNPNVGPPVSPPYRFLPLPTPVCVECPPPPSPIKESSKPEHPYDEKSGAGLATRAATTFRGEIISLVRERMGHLLCLLTLTLT
jgi:hypothetical protein